MRHLRNQESVKECDLCSDSCCSRCLLERNLCKDCTPTCNQCDKLLIYDQDQDNYDLMWSRCELCNSLTYYLCEKLSRFDLSSMFKI